MIDPLMQRAEKEECSMARDFLRRASGAHRSPAGALVTNIQSALKMAGSPAIAVDGRFGGETETALRAFQHARGMPETGTVSDVTWKGLMNTDEPGIFSRCLQVTAAFEGTGFDRVVGNFDGAGITWGLIGFTLVNGELGRVLQTAEQQQPGLVHTVFGANADEVLRITGPGSDHDEKIAWANSISTGPQNYAVVEPWKTCFHQLGMLPLVQKIEIDHARDAYWTVAMRDAKSLTVREELDYLLLFDAAVQNGGLGSKNRLPLIYEAIELQKPQTPLAVREIVAHVVADTSSKTYRNDVLSRKMAIATGQGAVHSDFYDLGDWGLLSGYVPGNPAA